MEFIFGDFSKEVAPIVPKVNEPISGHNKAATIEVGVNYILAQKFSEAMSCLSSRTQLSALATAFSGRRYAKCFVDTVQILR